MKRKITDSAISAWEWMYQNPGKTALVVGAAAGVLNYSELAPLLGTPEFEEAVSHIFPQALEQAPDFSQTTDLVIDTAMSTVGGTLASYVGLSIIDNANGLRNLGRRCLYEATPRSFDRFRRDVLDDICEQSTNPEMELERVLESIANKEPADMTIEYVRRTLDAMISQRYESIRGTARKKKSIFNTVRKIMGPHERIMAAIAAGTMSKEEAEQFLKKQKPTGRNKKVVDRLLRMKDNDADDILLLHMYLNAMKAVDEGDIEFADTQVRHTCEIEPVLTNRCVYGSFLDSLAAKDDDYKIQSAEHWAELIEDIITLPDLQSRFTLLPGSKNEVLELSGNETQKNMLIVKRSPHREELEREFKLTQFLFDIIGYQGTVPEALTFKKHGGRFYFIQKRLAGKTMRQVICEGRITGDAVARFVEVLDEYQRTVQRNQRAAAKYGISIPHMDYRKEYDTKFLQRMAIGLPDFNYSRIQEHMELVFDILNMQREGGCHGDMHGKNAIVGAENKICIIDHEKMFWGARILDWVNFLMHTKVEEAVNLEQFSHIGYDLFSRRGDSLSDYEAAYNCGKVFKSSHMAGSAAKYARAGLIDRDVGERRVQMYLDESINAFQTLAELLPGKYKQSFEVLREEYFKIRRSLST